MLQEKIKKNFFSWRQRTSDFRPRFLVMDTGSAPVRVKTEEEEEAADGGQRTPEEEEEFEDDTFGDPDDIDKFVAKINMWRPRFDI